MTWYAGVLMLIAGACWLAEPQDDAPAGSTLEWRLLAVPFSAAALMVWMDRLGAAGIEIWLGAVAAITLTRAIAPRGIRRRTLHRIVATPAVAALAIGLQFSSAAIAAVLDTIAITPLRSDRADATVALDPIVVTGTRTAHRWSDAPVDVQLITADDIAHSGARDLAELLEREGGVHVTPVAARGTRIEIQGLASEHVLILVDGRRLTGRINGAIDLTRLRVADVERIEIVKGPSSALYGADALGGVVNVITRRGGGRHAALGLRGDGDGSAQTWAQAGGSLGSVRGHGSAALQRSRAYDLDAATRPADGADSDRGYFAANLDWSAGRDATLGIDGAWALDDSRRLDPGSGTATVDTHKRIEEVRFGVAPQIALGGADRLALDAYYHRYFDQLLQRNADTGAVALDEETRADLLVAGGQFDRRVGTHLLSIGAEAQLERLEADRLQAPGERDRQAVYVQDQLDLSGGRLQLVPGLRYDRDSQFDEQLSPKLALRYDLDDAWILRAGYGRGYRAPDFKQLLLRFENDGIGYRVDGNPDLRPERSTGFNVGATWFAGPDSSIALSAYHHRVRDLIEIVRIEDGPPIVFSYRNVAAARLTGIDLQTRFRPWRPLDVRLGYGWLDAEDADSGEPLSGRARHRGNLALRFERAHYAVQWRGVWSGSRRFGTDVDSGGAPTAAGSADAYALYDLRAEWTGRAQWSFAAGVENVFDAGDPQYLPIRPRTAYLEIERSFR